MRIQTQYLKTFGGEGWQTEARLDLCQIIHRFPFPYVRKASPFNRDDLKSSKLHRNVNITLDSNLYKGEEGIIVYESGPNILPLENGTMKTFLL